MSRSRKLASGLAALLVVAACSLVIAGLWVGILAALAAVVAAGAAIWSLIAMQSKTSPPPELQLPGWVIYRPTEIAQVVTALIDRQGQTVGITTSLEGAGGFGKTTLAKMVCMDRRVRKHFGGRIYPVTLGRDVRTAAALAAKVNDVIKLVVGEEADFTDPELAESGSARCWMSAREGYCCSTTCGNPSSWRHSPTAADGASGWLLPGYPACWPGAAKRSE